MADVKRKVLKKIYVYLEFRAEQAAKRWTRAKRYEYRFHEDEVLRHARAAFQWTRKHDDEANEVTRQALANAQSIYPASEKDDGGLKRSGSRTVFAGSRRASRLVSSI